jgi:hypothetical protein
MAVAHPSPFHGRGSMSDVTRTLSQIEQGDASFTMMRSAKSCCSGQAKYDVSESCYKLTAEKCILH